jgi:hypothetical protein
MWIEGLLDRHTLPEPNSGQQNKKAPIMQIEGCNAVPRLGSLCPGVPKGLPPILSVPLSNIVLFLSL